MATDPYSLYGAAPGPMATYNAGGYNPTLSWSPSGGISSTDNTAGLFANPYGSVTGSGTSTGTAPSASGASSFDWGGLLGNLFGSLGNNAVNIGGGLAGNNMLTNAYDRTMNAANNIKYSPSAVNGMLGGVTPTRNADGSISYTVSPNANGQGLFGAASGMIGSGNQFLQNAGDPNAIAKDYYDQLTAMAKPGETTATQNLFNNLQSTGRLGLTQNGELGDIGGLQLAQQTADNQRRATAMQMGNDIVNQRAQIGGNLISSGIGSGLSVNNGLMTGLPYSIQGGMGDLTAATNRGTLAADAAQSLALGQGNLLSGAMQGYNTGSSGSGSGVGSQILGAVGNKVGNWLGGKIGDWLGGATGSGTSTAATTGAGGVASGAGSAAGALGAGYGGSELAAGAASSMPELSGSALAASQGMDPAIAAQINSDMAAAGGSAGSASGAGAAGSTGSTGSAGAGLAGAATAAALFASMFSAANGYDSKTSSPWEQLGNSAVSGGGTNLMTGGANPNLGKYQMDAANSILQQLNGSNMQTGSFTDRYHNWFAALQWARANPNDPRSIALLTTPTLGDTAKLRRNAVSSRTIK